jgi:drug/metabolite transporter (DMT)-like permease
VEWGLLALLSAFALAVSDALAKKQLRSYATDELVLVRLVYPAVLLLPGVLAQGVPPLPSAFWGWLALSLPLEVIAMALYVRALRDSPMSLCLPYLAFTPVFTVAIAWAVLGERVSRTGLAGIALVVCGTFVLHAGEDSSRGPTLLGPLRAFRRESGVRLMLGVALIYSVTTVTGKAAMQYMPSALFGAFYFMMLGIFTVIAMLGVRPGSLRVLARRPGVHGVIGFWFALMIVCHFLAIDRVQAAYMIAVKRSSILFAVLFGALLFGERELGRRLLAALSMVVGMALIGFGG